MRKILLVSLITTLSFSSGVGLYKKNCMSCHGVHGKKAFMGKKMTVFGRTKKEAIKELNGYKNGTLSKYTLGNVMKSQMKRFSKTEIEQLAYYMSKRK